MFHEATDQLFLSVGLNTAVSPNVPSTGAGTIETPGDRDIYTFSTATANQQVYIDRQDGSGVSCGSPDVWFTLVDPNALTVLPNFLSNGCQIDPGPRTLVTAGTYTLTVWANSDESGNYRFAVYEATDDTIPIDIGDIVSPGAPSAGAGSIETPGDRDLYTFPGSEGQRVYIDRQEGSGASCSPDFRYSLAGPTTTVFSNFLSLACSIDPGLRTLPEDGTYTLTVWGDGDEYGAHRFWLAGEVSDEGTLRYADQADGTLAVGDVYRYTFEGRDGDIAAAIMYRTGASEPDPHIQFRRPDGSDSPGLPGWNDVRSGDRGLVYARCGWHLVGACL